MTHLPSLLAATSALSLALPPTPAISQPVPVSSSSAQSASLFDTEILRAKTFVGKMMAEGIHVPVPRDPAGGFTHEQHTRNYRALYDAGELYRVTRDRRYLEFVRDMLVAYADLYPKLGLHPARKGDQQSGKLFWQNLNDAVWLVYAIQGYEAVRAELTAADRRHIDDDLFRNYAKFMSVDSVATFDLIHNHATWATAGVGMTGYVLGDRVLVRKALLGSKMDGRAGFLRQMDLLFSPDGYYAEGPYYQRYALMPFVVFADAIARNDPSQHIFERRDGILLKAINATIELTYAGRFFPFNDAIKDKSLNTEELYQGVAIGYAHGKDPRLLSIAAAQGRVAFSAAGREVARDLAIGLEKPFDFPSMLLRDGANGDQGAIAILRSGNRATGEALVAKNSSQGMGHGHFDKLNWIFYDRGSEIVTDYGSARFLNIIGKLGGRYLPENESWAKQSIAHNVLVVDERSQFDGDVKRADLAAPEQLYFEKTDAFSISIAKIDSAYTGVSITRSLALVTVPGLEKPIGVDLMRVRSDAPHRYDLPLHYDGQIIRLGGVLRSYITARPVLGSANGYQHIWVDAEGALSPDKAFLTWMTGNSFYTWRWLPVAGAKIILGQIGANDPDFNLRREPMLIQRVDGARDILFAGVLEGHGLYDGAEETTADTDSQIRSIRSVSSPGVDAMLIETLAGVRVVVAVAYDNNPASRHSVTVAGQRLDWRGPAARILLTDDSK